MKILKFIGLIAAMAITLRYVPYGALLCGIVQLVALWKLVNDGKSK